GGQSRLLEPRRAIWQADETWRRIFGKCRLCGQPLAELAESAEKKLCSALRSLRTLREILLAIMARRRCRRRLERDLLQVEERPIRKRRAQHLVGDVINRN